MPFERYVKTEPFRRPTVSITSGGYISLNWAAVEEFNVREYRYCVLFYDRMYRRIGIMLTNDPNEEGAIRIRIRNQAALIYAKSFLEYYRIPHRVTMMYTPQFDERLGMIVVDLTENQRPQRGLGVVM
ncbi:MAG: hypothetical protein KatS3mg115_0299 [Candidatus Poribacteria bacterium]|nr:MAG: hypothetical protein KatS3mg115_0299 [Candidatus Poribacteria bacterium]